MKRIAASLLFLLITVTVSFGQRDGHPAGRGMERIHAAKMAYITDRLHLTAEQSGNFTPLYNEYEQEKIASRRKYMQKYKSMEPDEADDATSKQFIDDNLDYQQEVIQIKRRYNDRFLKIITPQQLADLHQAEREFKQILMQRLRERRENGRGHWH